MRGSWVVGVVAVLVAGWGGVAPARAGWYAGPGAQALRAKGLVPVRSYARSIRTEVVYATDGNFTGARIPGYCAPEAWMLRRRAKALARVQRRLRRSGLGLKVYDAYRPVRASRAMVRWARRTGRGHLVGRYIARRSNHNVGSTVDLTLVRLRSGRELDMGSSYDSLSRRSHTYAVRGRPLRNRLTLVRAMEAEGFRSYDAEWWHFDSVAGAGTQALDLTLGCRRRG